MVSHSCSHDTPVGERGKKCEAIGCILGQIKNIPYLYVFYGKQWMVTGPFDLKSFRYKSFDTYLFSRVVNSFTYLSLRTKNIFTHNVFLVHAQTILEVIEIFRSKCSFTTWVRIETTCIETTCYPMNTKSARDWKLLCSVKPFCQYFHPGFNIISNKCAHFSVRLTVLKKLHRMTTRNDKRRRDKQRSLRVTQNSWSPR